MKRQRNYGQYWQRRAFWQQALQDAEAMHQQMQEAAAVPQHHLPQKAAPHRIPVRKSDQSCNKRHTGTVLLRK